MNKKASNSALINYISIFLIALLCIFSLCLGLLFQLETAYNFNVHSMIQADSSKQTLRLLRMLDFGEPITFGFFNYGNVQHFIAFYLSKIFAGLNFQQNYQMAVVSMFLVQGLGFCLCVLFGYLTLKSLTQNHIISVIGSISVFFSEMHFYWFYNIHPDTVQTCFLMLSIYCLLNLRVRNILISTVCVALAAGTKYIGASYLLLLGLISIFYKYEQYKLDTIHKSKIFAEWLVLATSTIFIFSVVFLLTNYSIIFDFTSFKNDFLYENFHVTKEHGTAVNTNPNEWFGVFYKQLYLFIFSLLFLTFYKIIFLLETSVKIPSFNFVGLNRVLFNNKLLIAAAITLAVSAAHLYFTVSIRVPRYTFHLYPLIIVIFGFIVGTRFRELDKRVVSRQKNKLVVNLFLFVLSAFLIGEVYSRFQKLNTDKRSILSDNRIEAGKLVDTLCSDNAIVLLPQYSYVPPKFNNIISGYIFSENQIMQSDVLVLNSSVPGRHIWPQENNEYSEGWKGHRATMRVGDLNASKKQYDLFYELVFSEENFKKVYDRSTVKVFIKNNSTICRF